MTNPAAEAAIKYTELGYKVYPVNVRLVTEKGRTKKKPSFKDGAWSVESGAKFPTDPDAIREHWEGYDGVVILCGPSGIVAIDVDQGDGKDGLANLKAAGLTLPKTPMRQQTASGGWHGLYRVPEGVELTSRQGYPVEHVDIRAAGGHGGLLFAEPTTLPDGRGWKFRGLVARDDLPELQADWVDLLLAADAEQSESAPLPADPEELLRRVREMPPGEGWTRLGPLSMRYAAVAMGVGMDDRAIEEAFLDAYRDRPGGTLSDARRSIRSALKKVEPWLPGDPEPDFDHLVAEEATRAEIRLRGQRQALEKIESENAIHLRREDAVDLAAPMESTAWVVPDLVAENEVTILYGGSRAAKTAMMVDLAGQLSIVGGTFMGADVGRRRVCYLAAEALTSVANRFRAWFRYHKVTPDPRWIEVQPGNLQLDNPRSVSRAVEYLRDFDVVVVDMLEYVTGGMSINTDAARIVVTLKEIAARAGVTMVVLHHPKATKVDKDGNPVVSKEMAGQHAAFFGKANYVLFAEPDGEHRYLVTVTKSKDSEDGARWTGRTVGGPGGFPVYVSEGKLNY
ncbi:bifunctional DNA primase/polymerase [Amycolatopsis sp. NPDC004772]